MTEPRNMNPAVVLAGRILLSLLFIYAGFGKLSDAAGTATYFANVGVPGGIAAAYVVGALEFFGGLAILLGFQTRIVAYVLAVFTLGTIYFGHYGDMQASLKNLTIVGGFLILGTAGAGAYSVDARSRRA
ncbi:membrane protein [Aureimonas ureilytica]|uniref:Membrane protein n=2 Tax=Aureimonas ureilytica TaxID=401562 RepID=A0A175RM62_9HYPH|nr:membrane protein [Aureimonas ureilytica]